MAFTQYDNSGLAMLGQGLDAVGAGFTEQRKKQTLAQLGQQYASGDTSGAVQSAIQLGDLGSAMKLADLAEDKKTWATVADRMAAGMPGGGAPAPAGGLGALGSISFTGDDPRMRAQSANVDLDNAPAMSLGGSAPARMAYAGPRTPALAGGGQSMRMPADPELEKRFISTLREGGLTNPVGLGALAAYANAESGYSPGNVSRTWSDPSQSGQPGTSGGLLSWRGSRLAAMQQATAGADDPVAAQAKFALTESPELTVALQNAKTPEEANQLMANAWRFAGYNQPGGGEYARRLAMTRDYTGRVGAPSQVASASPMPQNTMPSTAVPGGQPMTLPPEAMPQTGGPVQSAGAPSQPSPGGLDAGTSRRIQLAAQYNPDQPATAVASPAALQANWDLFINPQTGQPRTASEAASLMTGQGQTASPPVGVAQTAPSPAPGAGNLPAMATADIPAPGARDAQFVIPGSPQAAGRLAPPMAAPAPAPVASQAPMQLAPSAQPAAPPPAPVSPRNPVDPEMVKALVQNPRTREMGMKLWQQSQTGKDFGFQVVGDQLYRTDPHSGSAVPIPGATKAPQWTHFAGKDGSDYAFNPQNPSSVVKIVDGKAEYVDVTDPAERARIGSPDYKGPIQRGPDNQLVYPLKPQVAIDQKAETAFDTTANQGIAKRFEDLSKEGDTARTDLAIVGQIRDLGTQIDTGAKAVVQSRLASWGIKVGENVDKVEAYTSLVDKLTPSQRVPGSGSSSDKDVAIFKGSLPQLINTPGGNTIIENTLAGLAQYKLDRAVIAEKGLTKELTPAETIRQLRDLPSPYEAFKDFAKNGFKASGDIRPRNGGKEAPGGAVANPDRAMSSGATTPDASSAAKLTPADTARTLANAKAAITKGAPRDLVIKELTAAGVPTGGL